MKRTSKYTKSQRLKYVRRRLHAADPRCRECGLVTFLPEALFARYGSGVDFSHLHRVLSPEQRERMATVEHTVSKLNPLRGKTQVLTLLCSKCNGLRCTRELSELSREERVMAANFGLNPRTGVSRRGKFQVVGGLVQSWVVDRE